MREAPRRKFQASSVWEHRDLWVVVVGDLKIWIWRRFLCRLQNTFIFENLPFVWHADVFGPLVGWFFSLPSFGCCKVIWVPEPNQDETAIPFRLFSKCYHSKCNWRERVRNMSTLSIRLLFVDLLHLYHFLSTWSSMIVICEEVQWYDKPKFAHSIAHVGPSGMTASGIWWSILGCLVLHLIILRVYSKIFESLCHWAHARRPSILLFILFRFVCRICILRGTSFMSSMNIYNQNHP